MGVSQNFFRRVFTRTSRMFFEFLTKALLFRKSNESSFLKFLDFSLNRLKILSLAKNPHFKKFIDSKVAIDPLNDLPDLETSLTVLIPCSMKDFSLLPKVINEAKLNIKNQIFEIVIITPDPNLLPSGLGPLRILSDKHFLDQSQIQILLEGLNCDSGWIKQQLIKILFCLQDSAKNILILDADTILTKPKIYIRGETQLLSFAYEYHEPYIDHIKQVFPKIYDFGLTFVSHHQLWQKDIVHDIWSGSGLKDWLHSMDKNELSPISEYNTYGLYMYNFHSERVRLSRFANEQFSRKLLENIDEDLEAACAKFPDSCSISIHSYS